MPSLMAPPPSLSAESTASLIELQDVSVGYGDRLVLEHVNLTVPRGKVAFEVAPGTSLDPTERKCALDALNSLQTSESSTLSTGGASVPPSGFSSLMTIEW